MWLCLEPRAAQQHTWRAPSQQHERSFLPAAIDTSKGSRESSLSALPRRRAAFPMHFTLLALCPWPHHASPARASASQNQGQGYQRHRSAAGAWDEARKATRQLLCCHVFGFFLCFYLAAGETGSVVPKVHQGRSDNMTEDLRS